MTKTRKEARAQKPVLLKKVTYDVMKDAVTIWLPALGVLYAAVAGLWGLPYALEIVGTLSALSVFGGAVLKIDSKRYQNQPVEYDGSFIAGDPDPKESTYRWELDHDLNSLSDKDELRIKVVNMTPENWTPPEDAK